MTAMEKPGFVTIEDCLDVEQMADSKHEYLGGTVHAMSGGTWNHSAVATNAVGTWFAQLQGKSCRPSNSDYKIRIDLPDHTRFYYPDAQVVYQKQDGSSHFATAPTVVLEVLSPSTRRIDLGEKRDAYLTIPSLQVLILADSESPYAIVHRRATDGGFQVEAYDAPQAVIDLPEIEASLPFADLYQGIDFPSLAEP